MALHTEEYGDVTRLRMTSPGSLAVGMDVSAYVIRGVMVDTGFHRVRYALIEAAGAAGVRGAILTHWHEDHSGNAALLASRGLPVLARADTEATLRGRPHIHLYRRVVWGRPPALTAPLATFDQAGLRCIHTPGHSPDHQVVWDETTGTLFSGDLWLGVRARVLHTSEDPYRIIESLRTVLDLRPDRMFDAHRGPVERPIQAIQSKINWLGTTLQTIERRVNDGADDRAIVREVLGGEEFAGFVSFGDYSRRNLVRAVRRSLSP